jgi:hypothetical protein
MEGKRTLIRFNALRSRPEQASGAIPRNLACSPVNEAQWLLERMTTRKSRFARGYAVTAGARPSKL